LIGKLAEAETTSGYTSPVPYVLFL